MDTQYYKFSYGIPWKYDKHGNLVLSKIDMNIWSSYLKNKNKILYIDSCGLYETYLAASFFEWLKIFDDSAIYYKLKKENTILSQVFSLQGLSKKYEKDIGDNIKSYPVPILTDGDDLIYNAHFRIDKDRIKNITKNFCIDWSREYLPKFRNFKFDKKYDNYVVVFVDDFGISSFGGSFISDNNLVLNKLSSMGYTIVYVSKIYKNVAANSKFEIFSLHNAIGLIQHASYVLSRNYDFILMAPLLGRATAIYEPNDNIIDIDKNMSFYNLQHKVVSYNKFLRG